jgi:4-amino-4-deoxy-L-arabinose transferase-like glycosyltransferase
LKPTRIVLPYLLLIIITYLIMGILFAIRTPAWQAPDEPAHYNYIAQVATDGCCPVIEMGDWDSPYLEELKAARFAPEQLITIDSIQYEDHQPPLYYLLLSPVYQVTNANLTALRITSVLIGTIIVLCAFGIGAAMFPTRPEIGLATAAFVAFQPQHLAILSSVNNDALGWALISLILLLTILYLKGEPDGREPIKIRAWHLGILVGIALITKSTAYFMAGVVLLAILLRWANENMVIYFRNFNMSKLRPLLLEAAAFLIPALLIGGLWWLRNFSVYGFPDFLGLAAHDEVVVGQLRTADYVGTLGTGGYLSEALRTTFYSFWGMFGWQALPLVGDTVGWIYPLIGLLLLFGLSGLIIDWTVLRDRRAITTTQRTAWVILVAVTAFAILQYLYYNTEFVQFQGRYMFPMLIPLGIWLSLGLDMWRRLLLRRFEVSRWFLPLLFFGFAILDIWLLWRVIVPNLSPI